MACHVHRGIFLVDWCYHVLNRGVGRRTLFEKDGDFLAFERVVEETLRTCRMRICAIAFFPTTGTPSSGRSPTATCPPSCSK